jgi:plastocyanin
MAPSQSQFLELQSGRCSRNKGIDNFTFAPATITVEPGTTVKWLNRDDIPRTVVAKSLAFRSKALDTDDSFSHRFDDVGVVDYFYSLHPHMTGRVVVRPHGSIN